MSWECAAKQVKGNGWQIIFFCHFPVMRAFCGCVYISLTKRIQKIQIGKRSQPQLPVRQTELKSLTLACDFSKACNTKQSVRYSQFQKARDLDVRFNFLFIALNAFFCSQSSKNTKDTTRKKMLCLVTNIKPNCVYTEIKKPRYLVKPPFGLIVLSFI